MYYIPEAGPSAIRIFGIDPGTDKMGICIIDVDVVTHLPTLIFGTTLRAARESENYPEKMLRVGAKDTRVDLLCGWVYELLVASCPTVVVAETPFWRPGRTSAFEALVECFKYALKMQNLDPEIQLHCYDVLKGRRLHTSFGCLYGLKLEDNTNDELLAEDLEYIDMLYKYSEGFGYQLMPGNVLTDNLVYKIKTGQSLK